MLHIDKPHWKLILSHLFLPGFLFVVPACGGGGSASPKGSVSAVCVCRGMGKTGSILGRGETDAQAKENARQRCESLNSSASNCRIVNP